MLSCRQVGVTYSKLRVDKISSALVSADLVGVGVHVQPQLFAVAPFPYIIRI